MARFPTCLARTAPALNATRRGSCDPPASRPRGSTHRDRIGRLIDSYLATRPAPEMREAIEVLEDSVRIADHACRLT
jgi:hypothetical protein